MAWLRPAPLHVPSCRRLSAAAVLVTFLAVAGCGGDDPSDPLGLEDGDEEALGQVSAQVAGVEWTATEVTTTYFPDRVTFVAEDDEWRMVVQVRGFTGPGTYALTDSDPIATIHLIRRDSTGVWGGVSAVGTGEVTIASATTDRAAGTFHGVLPQSPGSHTDIDTVAITNGTFDVPR